MSAEEYKQIVDGFIDILKSDESVLVKVYNGLNAVGREYFKEYHGDDIILNNNDMKWMIKDIADNLKAINKSEYIEEMGEYGMKIDEDSVAFDDAYRHSAIVDITDITNPIVKNPCNSSIFKDVSQDNKYFDDYCFSWLSVNKYTIKFLEAGKIIVHFDGIEQFYFPLPSSDNSN